MFNRKLKIKIKTNGMPIPESHGEYYDLCVAEDVNMKRGDFKILSLGICVEAPKGYYCEIVPRSSTCKKFGIIQANSIGVIEQAYCGNKDIWGFPALAVRDTTIPKGTRICQFCVKKRPIRLDFIPVLDMKKSSRGGWGSTGA